MTADPPGVAAFAAAARDWLAARLRAAAPEQQGWGEGSDDLSVFHRLTPARERALLAAAMAWQQEKFDAGYGAITWPAEYGGAGLSAAHERAFSEVEAAFATPEGHETFAVTTALVAPTVAIFGTPGQRARFVRRFLRAEELCCQLFSEPGAGSDLAGLATRAERDGDEWVINGQKVWSSGAQFAAWGELIARTDPSVPKHAGMTAFLVPLDAPGVRVRPIRQMSGGSSFCEVFLTDVRVPDDLRLGAVGSGWKVALTTLGFERGGSGGRGVGGSWERLLGLARWLGRTGDPVVRQQLASVYIHQRVRHMNASRAIAAAAAGQPPGPEGSIGKLLWVTGMTEIGQVAAGLLGARLTADTGEWGTFAWNDHILGSPGYRIAGGSDEIQRNIIAERVLGLPGDIRVDRDVPWREIPR
ncbi:MAG TPA: acyl-CoA dehydrogenase family protein [Trebonia sp.]|nr:acyl-CoA dehydrogenase family protein [Trebonia sp.]